MTHPYRDLKAHLEAMQDTLEARRLATSDMIVALFQQLSQAPDGILLSQATRLAADGGKIQVLKELLDVVDRMVEDIFGDDDAGMSGEDEGA